MPLDTTRDDGDGGEDASWVTQWDYKAGEAVEASYRDDDTVLYRFVLPTNLPAGSAVIVSIRPHGAMMTYWLAGHPVPYSVVGERRKKPPAWPDHPNCRCRYE